MLDAKPGTPTHERRPIGGLSRSTAVVPVRARAIAVAGAALLAVCAALTVAPAALAETEPSGEVVVGNSVIEPAYNIGTGGIVYLKTPKKTVVNPNAHQTAPLYLIVYPKAFSLTGALNCEDIPFENCVDHGPAIAGLAQEQQPAVYGEGVLGHDHLVGVASSDTDFNVNWEPIVELFTPTATIRHITKIGELESALAQGELQEIKLPQATFHCSVVSGAAYAKGVPLT